MKPSSITITLTLILAVIASGVHAGWDPRKSVRLEADAETAIEAIKRKDPSLQAYFDRAEGWAVFPNVGKAGAIVGGAYGKGVVYSHGRVIGYAELIQGTVGLQLGGQEYSEIIFFKAPADLARFKSGKLELGAQASAVKHNESASTNLDYSDGVAIFTLIKGGLMAEASVGGQRFVFHPMQ